MIFPLHENNEGSFQELAHSDDVKFGQLSLLKVNPNCKRGGHFHIHKKEWFCCIHGKCEMQLVNVKNGEIRNVELDDNNSEFILVKPHESHTVINKGESVCELLVIISEKYDEKISDTFKFEV